MRASTRIAVNHATRWGTTFVQGIIALALVPFFIRTLGKDGYGVVGLLIAVVGLCAMADFGLRTALVRHLADAIARADHRRFNELFSTAVFVTLTAGSGVGLLWAVLSPTFVPLFNVPPAEAAQAQWVIRWYAAVAIPLSFVLPVYGAVVFASGRSDVVDGISGGTGLIQAVALVVVLGPAHGGLAGWAVVSAGEQILRLVSLRYAAGRIVGFAHATWRLVSRDAIRRLFSASAYPFMLQLLSAASTYADPFVLTTILGPAAVAVYRAGTVLPIRIQPLFSIADQLHPFAVGYRATGQTDKFQDLLVRGTRYTVLLGILPATILGIFSEPITRFWLARALGPDYRSAARVLTAWVIVELFTTTVGGAQWPIFLAADRLRFLTWSQIPFTLLNLTLSVVLVAFTSAGVLGVVIGAIVVALVRRPMLIVYAAWACGLRVKTYVMEAYARPAVVFVVLAAVAGAWLRLGFAESLPGLIAGTAMTGFAWFLLVWCVGLTAGDRRDVRSMLAGSRLAFGLQH